jgi:hypothetical protein
MLMVIFGAGASYDSCSSFPPDQLPRATFELRPPLAKELFLPLREFRSVSNVYRRCQSLLPYLEAQEDVEGILEEFRARSEKDIECRSQLLAIQYYLSDVIQRCEHHWMGYTQGVSNYKTLLDQVRACPQVFFVTFNYDTLIERALTDMNVPMTHMNSYTSHPRFSLIKLHGSIDWHYWVPATTVSLPTPGQEQPQPSDLIRAAPVVGDRAIIEKQGLAPQASQRELFYFLPALAIPTVSKHAFICPPDHLRALEQFIPSVTKIAIVGWRAAERNFLQMLTTGLRNSVQVIAACGNVDAADATLGRLSAAGIKGNFQPAPGGFTDFVVNRRIVPFLAAAVGE